MKESCLYSSPDLFFSTIAIELFFSSLIFCTDFCIVNSFSIQFFNHTREKSDQVLKRKLRQSKFDTQAREFLPLVVFDKTNAHFLDGCREDTADKVFETH